MQLLQHTPLKDYTTFRIGGPARHFCTVKTIEEVQCACLWAHNNNWKLCVLGGGSNVLIADEGFDGLVMHIALTGIEQQGDTFTVAAGEVWDDFVAYVVAKGYGELANLSLIPGTVGAAPIQNIGAYGREVCAFITHVLCVHTTTGEHKTFSNAECAFTYRGSFFKTVAGKEWVIVKVIFALSRTAMLDTSYKDIAEYAQKNNLAYFSPQSLRDTVIAIRRAKLPDWTALGTAGSYFKNPVIAWAALAQLQKAYPGIPSFPFAHTMVKVSAGWILDKICNAQGMREGDAGIYEKQALVIVNHGHATAYNVRTLAEKLRTVVHEKTNIHLETEVQYIS